MQLVATRHDPIPQGAVVQAITVADGTTLRAARWLPAGEARGTVVVLNGRTEYIEKYFEIISQLLERGFAVATLDWRGQGLSDRPLEMRQKGWVQSFDLYISDLHEVFEGFVKPACPPPYRVLSHSMGGNIVLRYLHEHPETFASAIFSSPMWGVGTPARTPGWMRFVASAVCAVGFSEAYLPGGGDWGVKDRTFETNVLTHDPKRFARMIDQIDAQPRLALGGTTAGWIREALHSMEIPHAPGFAEAIEIPIRVCTAGADKLVSNASHAQLVARMPDAKQTVVPHASHELLIEEDQYRDEFVAMMDETWGGLP